MTENYEDGWVQITSAQTQPSDFRMEEFEAGIASIGIIDFTSQKTGDITPVLQIEFDDNGPAINFFPPKSLDPMDIKGFQDIGKIFHALQSKGIDIRVKQDFSAMVCIPNVIGTKVKMIPKKTEQDTGGEVKTYTNWDMEVLELVTGDYKQVPNGNGTTGESKPSDDVSLEDVKSEIMNCLAESIDGEGNSLPVRSADIIKYIKLNVDAAVQPGYNKFRNEALKELEEEGVISKTNGSYCLV